MIESIRFVPNPLFGEQLQHSEGVQHAVDVYADDVAAKARSLAPVLTGALRDSIHVQGAGGDAAEADVVADVPYAAYVEFGTSTRHAEPFLRPAADAVLGRGPA